ncbi:MAG TPA: transglycosylase domain-containing protein [Acidimicrobiales bacterium]|nr:transglycosylase domain-containing protein [Acidimicrobiales bacterium]
MRAPERVTERVPRRVPERALERPPARTRPRIDAPGAPKAPKTRAKRPSFLWRYRRLWFLVGLLFFTAIAGVAWVVTHIPLPPEVPQAQTSIVYDGAGRQLALFHGDENRFPVRLEEVPIVAQHAVIAAEDRNFFEHRGIDPVGIARATWADIRRKAFRQGGSTITQQYVKNAFLDGGKGRNLVRKLKEAAIAVKLEHKYSKQEILERYLNAVYFGRGAYGIQAAAKAYFGTDASQLGLRESAYLAGIIRMPSSADVHENPAQAEQLRSSVLTAMVEERRITQAQADEVRAVPLESYVIRPAQSQTTVTSDVKGVQYFVEYVRQQLLATYSEAEVLGGGLRVYTTLDPMLQTYAYDAVYNTTLNRPNDPAGALVSLDGEGRVVAMVGGRDWNASKVNLAVGNEGGGSGRQGGSAFKPFVLAATVREGYTIESSFRGPAKIVIPRGLAGEDWPVANYEDASFGQINLIDATVNSVNTVYAQLVTAIGAEKVVRMAGDLGIRSRLDVVPSIALGTQNVSVLEMAGAYLTLAREGVRVDPRVIRRITVGDTVLVDDRSRPTRVLEKDQADTVNFVLRQVVERGSGTRAKLPGGPAWGKTGTTEDYGDAWFIGFNRKLTTAVWMGHPAGQSRPLVNVHGVPRVNGGSLPADIWRKYMSKATPNEDGEYAVPRSFPGRILGARIPYSETPSSTAPSAAVSRPAAPAPTAPKAQAPPPSAAPPPTAAPPPQAPPPTALQQQPPQQQPPQPPQVPKPPPSISPPRTVRGGAGQR